MASERLSRGALVEAESEWGFRSWKHFAGTMAGIAVAIATVAALFGAVIWIGDATNYEPTWQWGAGAYLVLGLIVGALGGLTVFGLAWAWSVQAGGFWGFAIGWAPSALLGWIVGLLLIVLWLPAALFGAWWFEHRF